MANKRAPHRNRTKGMIPVWVMCPTCGKMFIEYYEVVPPEKVPRRYCDKHDGNREESEYGYGYDEEAA